MLETSAVDSNGIEDVPSNGNSDSLDSTIEFVCSDEQIDDSLDILHGWEENQHQTCQKNLSGSAKHLNEEKNPNV